MEKQAELQWKMRCILMDWIVEVHSKFRLLPETLFIATNLIDRFLSARVISLVKFQLVGLTALFVAAKYEEVICPSISHFLHMSDGGYGIEEILKAKFLIEISCLEHRLLRYPPSMLAAAGLWLARMCLDRGDWVSTPRLTL